MDEAEGAQLNLLFMGNSYTDYYNLPAFVSALAVADGYDVPLIVADLQGAQNVAYHLGEVTNNPQDNVAHPNIAGMTFDFAVIQGHSQEATSRRDPANDFIPNSIAWADAVRSAVAGADTGIVLYETWAREADHHFYPSSFANPAAMQLEIRTNNDIARAGINQNAGAVIAMVAPVGDAFESTGFDPTLYDLDQSHPSVLGSRLAAMVIYRTIYGELVGDIPYSAISNPGISQSEWLAAQGWADSVPIAPVPLPGSLVLMFSGIGSLLLLRRRRSGS